MDLKGTKDNILAKANNGIEYYCPPSEDGGNSDGGNSDGGKILNRNAALAHSIINRGKILNIQNEKCIQFNRNAALAHSIKMNQTNSIGMGFNPFKKMNQTNSIGMGFNPFKKMNQTNSIEWVLTHSKK